jgi:hypothetical protein
MRYVIRKIRTACYEDNCRADATHVIWADGGEFGSYCHPHAVAKVESLERYEQAVDYANRKQPGR